MIDCYEKLTIGVYDELQEIYESNISDYEKNVEIVALFNDMDVADVEDLSLTTFNTLLQSTAFLYEMPKKKIVATKYILGGTEFDVVLDMQSLTVSQYLDYQEFVKNPDKNRVELLSVFLVPMGKKYGDYNMQEVHKLIRDNLSIIDAIALTDFFLLLSQSLMKVTLRSLKRRLKRMKRKMKSQEEIQKMEEAIAHLETVGDGYDLLTK